MNKDQIKKVEEEAERRTQYLIRQRWFTYGAQFYGAQFGCKMAGEEMEVIVQNLLDGVAPYLKPIISGWDEKYPTAKEYIEQHRNPPTFSDEG